MISGAHMPAVREVHAYLGHAFPGPLMATAACRRLLERLLGMIDAGKQDEFLEEITRLSDMAKAGQDSAVVAEAKAEIEASGAMAALRAHASTPLPAPQFRPRRN